MTGESTNGTGELNKLVGTFMEAFGGGTLKVKAVGKRKTGGVLELSPFIVALVNLGMILSADKKGIFVEQIKMVNEKLGSFTYKKSKGGNVDEFVSELLGGMPSPKTRGKTQRKKKGGEDSVMFDEILSAPLPSTGGTKKRGSGHVKRRATKGGNDFAETEAMHTMNVTDAPIEVSQPPVEIQQTQEMEPLPTMDAVVGGKKSRKGKRGGDGCGVPVVGGKKGKRGGSPEDMFNGDMSPQVMSTIGGVKSKRGSKKKGGDEMYPSFGAITSQ